jgi:alkylation response protein AidB-like acyl-CoA dehydrogenase
MIGPAALAARGQETRSGLGAPDIGTANTPGNWLSSFYIARSGTIYAGTSEVQRNIIGDRILGLPREPRADTGSWRESQRSG